MSKSKSSNYIKDKDAFLKELKQFNESKNIPYKTPIVNGIEIDLYLFYTLVQQRGGLHKVNHTNTWDTLLRPLKLPYPCVNGSTLLRRLYGTYLEKFEKAKGPPGRDDDNDMDEDPRRGSRSGIPRVSFASAGAYITASGETLRTPSRVVAGPAERLALSLLSPMPNEQDFAINVCTVLAADHSNRLPLATTPHILDFLLAHAGVYNHFSLRDTIGRSYFEARGRYPHEFWQMRAGGGGAKELADESKFMSPGLEQPELMVQALAAHNTLTDCLMNDGEFEDLVEKANNIEVNNEVVEDWVTEPSDEDQLFAGELPGGATCVYTQRVLQVASILRSLSFHDDNLHYLAKNTTLIRFLLLCANSWVGTLRQSGLDTLGNISTELVIKEPATCLISRHILSTVQSALVSPDRARVLAALELLNKLAQNELNEDALLKALEAKVYSDVCALLTLRDIMVLVCTLECVYALTSLGDRASEAVARVPGLVHTLVSLVTVEAQSYGPRACILMRVVETVSGPGALAAAQDKDQPQQLQPLQNTPVKVTPEPAATSPAPPAAAPAVPTNIQQSHNQQRTVQENEQFAQAWLRSAFEVLPVGDNSACEAGDVYRQYVACCTKLGRKGVIAPAHFPRLVRTVFGGTVGPNTATLSTGETQQVYIGIRAKTVANRTIPAAGPSSPILKAQLTNKTPDAKTEVKAQTQSPSHPHLSQALEAGPAAAAPSTTLIKHLLAHKVSPAHNNTQVAQRQQNQQRGGATNAVVVQSSQSTMEVDPEALIKCTTITPGGIASSTPTLQGEKIILSGQEEVVAPKEEPVQIQIDEQTQLTIKSAQNKMLADLLEKKSNPPVQVVQMSPQVNAPTIQITETGQIVQVKSDHSPLIQFNPDGNLVTPGNQYFQIKNDQGQIIQIKNDQGQIIQLKADQLQSSLLQFKNDQGQLIQIKNDPPALVPAQVIQNIQGQFQIQGQMKTDKDQLIETVNTDHSYTETPSKKMKIEDKREMSPQESVSKTAANLYAALAASALEDEEDLIPPKQEQVEVMQQPVIVAGTAENPSVIIQEPMLQVQQPMKVQQSALQQTLQVHPNSMQMQAPIQVQQPTLQVQQPLLQVQPMDVQNIIASQAGQIILQAEKPITSQQTQFMQQPVQLIATPASQGGLSYIAQNIPGNMMQKTIIIVQGPTGGGPLTLTVNNPAGLDEATLNTLIAQATEAITHQQIIQNTGVIQSTQRVLNTPLSSSVTMVKTALTQNNAQLTPSQQPIITAQPQPHKAQIVNQQQIMVTPKQPPALISTSGSNQIIQTNQQLLQSNQQLLQGNQQLLQGNQQLIQGNQQIIQTPQIIQGNQQLIQGGQQIIVSSNQQIIMNAPMKGNMHRVVQPQRNQVVNVQSLQNVQSNMNQSIVQTDNKTSVIQTSAQKPQQPVVRQVITRQPVMLGNTKIGDKEMVVTQPVIEKPAPPKPTVTPPPAAAPPSAQEDTPWICHWRGCNKSFGSASGVYAHAAQAHCPRAAGGEAACLWLDCDRVPRRTFALLNHLSDKHCTAHALKALYNSRRQTATEADSKPVSLGYPPNAALAALNKHATDMFNPRELMHRADIGRTPEPMDENEGPVTKSIRLTAALILRNIVIYSNTGRRQLRSYEAHLACIALSSVEASRTIAQVLYDMNNI